MAITTMIGAKIHRREDPRLVSGEGRYIDDFTRPGTLFMAVVRSPHAHALINSIDASSASKAPGVVAIYTHKDIAKVIAGTMPAAPAFVAEKKQVPARYPIAEKEVAYQGEPVAIVIAESKYQASDAANLLDVDYQVLPAVMDIEAAIDPKSPTAHVGAPDNIGWDLTYIPEDAAAMKGADVVVKQRIWQQRLAPTPMETRGVLAEYSHPDQSMTIWMSSQNPHFIRLFLAGALGMPETRIRVISPDVGGGFGSKISPYSEDYLVPAAAKLSGRPVKWIESRTESLQTTTHGRGQVFEVEAGATKDGKLVALKVTQYLDMGAYVGTFGAFQACACLLATGAYNWKHVSTRTVGVLTNRVPTDPYRGAGRPEATHLCERMIDLLAAELKLDPAEMRRKNFITEFPHTSHFGLVYDSGAYEKAMDKAMEIAGYATLRKEQEEARKKGRYLGIGLSSWIEICGFGPSAATAPATGGLALVESAQVRVFPTGSVTVYVGTHSHGQWHDTTFPQIVADTLGIPYDMIELRHGDTAEGPAFGYGTYGSRSLAVGGMAVHKASMKIVDKARKLAAHIFEAAEEDVVFDHGQFYVKGSPDKRKGMGEIAFASFGAGLPEGMEHGLEAVAYYDPTNFVWPFGTHIAVVEVDPETGAVDLQRYIAVDDCGNIINPMIVDGQLHGGIAQGISQALFEEVVYDDESGQLKTGSLVDYLVPTANEFPNFELGRTITPSPTNELGVKGIGEAGTIASSIAVINAICDALRPLGINHVDMPATPDRLWKQIQGTHRSSSNGKEARQ
ncbi:MAG: xanthine dehydrogenase family protein molybdopterin-binding subunit [Candidatus Dormibacteraceae bacterium]